MKGISWGSVWKISGDPLEERYRVLSREFESLRHLRNTLQERRPSYRDVADWGARSKALQRVDECLAEGRKFAEWYMGLSDKSGGLKCVGFFRWLSSRRLFQSLGADRLFHRLSPRSEASGILVSVGFLPWLSRRIFKNKPPDNIGPMKRFQQEVAKTAGLVMTRILLPEWQKETESLLFDKSRVQAQKPGAAEDRPFTPSTEMADHVRTAEEFFVLPYLGFVQNTIGRMRTIVFGMLMIFVAMTLAISSYPFEPLAVLGGVFLGLFVLVGGILISVYAGMNPDATLSYVTDTKPGELGLHFWAQLATFGITPLFALITTLFPSLSDFLASWGQP